MIALETFVLIIAVVLLLVCLCLAAGVQVKEYQARRDRRAKYSEDGQLYMVPILNTGGIRVIEPTKSEIPALTLISAVDFEMNAIVLETEAQQQQLQNNSEVDEHESLEPVFMYSYPENNCSQPVRGPQDVGRPQPTTVVTTFDVVNNIEDSTILIRGKEEADDSTNLLSRNPQGQINIANTSARDLESSISLDESLSRPPPAYVLLDTILSRPNQISTVYYGDSNI